MSLTALLNSAAQTAFEAIGDLKESGSIVATGSAVYDPVTGEYTTTDTTDTVAFVKYEFERSEIDGQAVRNGDAKFLVRTEQLTLDARVYAHFTHNSQQWDIQGATSVPGDSVVIFHVRLTSG